MELFANETSPETGIVDRGKVNCELQLRVASCAYFASCELH